MKRFSYMLGGLDGSWDIHSHEAQLNELGQQGWELVGISAMRQNGNDYTVYYLKREIPHDNAQRQDAPRAEVLQVK